MTIGLALSGGGALGGAHIGILDVLTRLRLRIDLIGGTSAGSLIGLLYAAGGMAAIDSFLKDMTERGIINFALGPVLKTGERIFVDVRQSLDAQLRGRSFTDLDIPFFCVATDIHTGELVLLDRGDPVSAVLASCAYPGVFPMQKLDGRLLVDGGLVNNLPSELLRTRGAEFLIGSSLYCLSPLTPDQRRGRMNRLQVAVRALEIIEKFPVLAQLAHCDFCFTPPVDVYHWFDFSQVAKLRAIGSEYAESRSDELQQRLSEWVAGAPMASGSTRIARSHTR